MAAADDRERASVDVLAEVVNDLAGEFRLVPLLQRILRSAVELLGCRSGSICLVDQVSHTYRKEIDLDEGCETGQVFSLDEGATGAVVRAGKPVIFDQYAQVRKGHIRPEEPRYRRGVIGVPIVLGADVIGSCIVFAASDDQQFTESDAQLLQRFATHAAIAIANSRLHADAADRARAAAVAAERERAMLEVHDSVGRGLAKVALRIAAAHSAASRGESPLAELKAAQVAAQETINEGRRAIWGLGPSGLAQRSLEANIGLELDWVRATTDLAATFRVFGQARTLSRNLETQALRIVQEALANVTQHAAAAGVRVGLVYGPDGIAVIVEDDGSGFDPESVGTRGVGLSGLVTRAAHVGGRVRIDSTPGWGTRIRADLPYRLPAGGADSPRLRVVVLHPLPAMRSGLVRLLEASEPGVQVVAEVDEAAAAVEAVRLLHPDLILAGTRVRGGAGAELLAQLQAVDPGVRVLGVIDPGTSETELRDWAAAGVRGFVDADVDAGGLGRAVVGVGRGEVLVSGGALAQLGGLPAPEGEPLTAREREVRALLETGLADKQIAARLGISVKTVEKHVSAVLRKLDVRSRTQLLARA